MARWQEARAEALKAYAEYRELFPKTPEDIAEQQLKVEKQRKERQLHPFQRVWLTRVWSAE